jgi:hypothetical protein
MSNDLTQAKARVCRRIGGVQNNTGFSDRKPLDCRKPNWRALSTFVDFAFQAAILAIRLWQAGKQDAHA